MLRTIHGRGHPRCYVIPISVCATKNYDLPIEDSYSGLICQHSLVNILNVSQRSIKLLHQPMKPHGLVGNFTNKQKGNKEAYDPIDAFLHKLKEDIGETIATR